MSDIRAGDVVVCVEDSDCICCGRPVAYREGRTYRVARVFTGYQSVRRFLFFRKKVPALGLTLVGCRTPGHSGETAESFRKIDAPKTEISERIKRCRPIKQPAPASLRGKFAVVAGGRG